MGELVKKTSGDAKRYDALSRDAFKKIEHIASVLKFERLVYVGKFSKIQTFFDTNTNMLANAGVLLSKNISAKKCNLIVEKQSFVPKTFRSSEDSIYVHPVQARDKISAHSFFLVDGITSMFTTSFSIDLENVLKNVRPKMEIKTAGKLFRIISGTGLRISVYEENVTYKNFDTGRKVEKIGVTLENESSAQIYVNQFNEIVGMIEKFCKELMPINETEYDYAKRLTKIIPPKPKEDKKKKKDLNKIQG